MALNGFEWERMGSIVLGLARVGSAALDCTRVGFEPPRAHSGVAELSMGPGSIHNANPLTGAPTRATGAYTRASGENIVSACA